MILISRKQKKIVKLKAESEEVFDVSGAGDTVVSYIAAGLASSLKIEDIGIVDYGMCINLFISVHLFHYNYKYIVYIKHLFII